MKNKTNGLLLVITIILFGIYGCTKSPSDVLQSPNPNQTTYAVTLSTSPTLGDYLVDKDGFTLYFFSNDYQGQNNCPGSCSAIWPYFDAGTLTVDNLGNGLNLADFGTTNVGGFNQTTYKGWPLYYYAPSTTDPYGASSNVREAPGLTGGDGYGNIWFVAKPDYTVMLANGQLTGYNGVNYLSNYTPGDATTLYFTDPKGMTLYTFKHDSANINKFTHADFLNNSVWPIYETTQIVVPSILDRSLFSFTTVFGHQQLTYKGWPLYFFGADNNVMGSNKGISVPGVAVWPVPVMDINPAP